VELLAEERADRILKLVEERKFVKVEDLAELFDVSHRTIRRDFEKLEQNGLLKRTYGGAMTTRVDDNELGMDVRGDFFAIEKQRIGKAAADMVKDGEAIMLDAGTTVQYVAKYIKTRRGLTVVTNAVNIINELANCEGITLVVTGGTLRPSTFSLVGAQTQEMLRNINADWAFIGTSGITNIRVLV
jgi:DeoR family fructose operon transcriptional repressor